jgi:hypothetical protein
MVRGFKGGKWMAYIYPVLVATHTKYRVYYLHRNKRIYIGLYDKEENAKKAYQLVDSLMHNSQPISAFKPDLINFKKYVSLINFRDHSWYSTQPIYLYDTFFYYYFSPTCYLTLDKRDLLFFSTHTIGKKNNYIYIQYPFCKVSILDRFGLNTTCQYGKDYCFRNGNRLDFRRENLEILNIYKGVKKIDTSKNSHYVAQIYTDRPIIIGHYDSAISAAIAYNKAADYVEQLLPHKNYKRNDLSFLTQAEYDTLYNQLLISPRIAQNTSQKRILPTSGYRGVCYEKAHYRALIGFNKKQIYLGVFSTAKRAAQAYNFASICLYGKEGYVNNISPLTNPEDEPKILKKIYPYLPHGEY